MNVPTLGYQTARSSLYPEAPARWLWMSTQSRKLSEWWLRRLTDNEVGRLIFRIIEEDNMKGESPVNKSPSSEYDDDSGEEINKDDKDEGLSDSHQDSDDSQQFNVQQFSECNNAASSLPDSPPDPTPIVTLVSSIFAMRGVNSVLSVVPNSAWKHSL